MIHSSGYISIIDFSGKKMLGLSGTKNGVHAALYAASDKKMSSPLYTVDGTWNGSFTIKDSKGNEIETYDSAAHTPVPLETADLTKQDPWESRKAWGATIAALDKGEMQGASDAKSRVEQAQRAMRKEEQAKGKQWTPVFFEKLERDERLENLRAVAPEAVEEDKSGFGFWRFSTAKARKARKPWHGGLVPGA